MQETGHGRQWKNGRKDKECTGVGKVTGVRENKPQGLEPLQSALNAPELDKKPLESEVGGGTYSGWGGCLLLEQ